MKLTIRQKEEIVAGVMNGEKTVSQAIREAADLAYKNGTQEREKRVRHPKYTFYVADNIRRAKAKIFKEDLSLKRAVSAYAKLKEGYLGNNRVLGLQVKDGSCMEGNYPIFIEGRLQRSTIDLVPYLNRNAVIKNLIRDCDVMTKERRLYVNPSIEAPPGVSLMQIEVMKELAARGVDLRCAFAGLQAKNLEQNALDNKELKEFRRQLAVMDCPDLVFSEEQRNSIQKGIDMGLGVFPYGRPSFKSGQMWEIQRAMIGEELGFFKDGTAGELMDMNLTASEMHQKLMDSVSHSSVIKHLEEMKKGIQEPSGKQNYRSEERE